MKMRINRCLKQKKEIKKEMKREMKKDRDMSMTTTTNPNLTTSQSMSTIKTSKKNHKCSNLHSNIVPTYIEQHERDLHSIETQLQNMMWYQQQTLENINKSQAEYMAELRAVKGKQQEMYDNNDRFYNQIIEEQREMAKEIQQVKNYQVNQTMVDLTRNKAIMDELAAVRSRQEEFFSNQTNQYNMIRQEQKLLGKEILDVKKYQMSAVTMGSSSSPQKYEPDQALVKIDA
ncbi:hypothetical protein PIB30_096153, partial [Stylosanthes scabra]|nr:hypothetical protein [Stylosanthes scabra]